MKQEEHNEKVRKNNYWRTYWLFMIFMQLLILNWTIALGFSKVAEAIKGLGL